MVIGTDEEGVAVTGHPLDGEPQTIHLERRTAGDRASATHFPDLEAARRSVESNLVGTGFYDISIYYRDAQSATAAVRAGVDAEFRADIEEVFTGATRRVEAATMQLVDRPPEGQRQVVELVDRKTESFAAEADETTDLPGLDARNAHGSARCIEDEVRLPKIVRVEGGRDRPGDAALDQGDT